MTNTAITQQDIAVARVVEKTLEMFKAWGSTLGKIQIADPSETGMTKVVVSDVGGRVVEAFVNKQLNDGRHFIDFNTHSSDGTDYHEFCVSSVDSYVSLIDDEISAFRAAQLAEETADTAPRI
jgi:hypothetical protein